MVRIKGVCYQRVSVSVSVSVSTGRYVLCRGLNLTEYYDGVPVELTCPVVKAAAHVAIVDVLPVDRIDFLLGYFLHPRLASRYLRPRLTWKKGAGYWKFNSSCTP